MDLDVDHIDIRVYGPRNALLGHARIPAHLVKDFSEMLRKARTVNPVYDVGLLARWLMKSGYRSVQNSLSRGQVELKPGGAE